MYFTFLKNSNLYLSGPTCQSNSCNLNSWNSFTNIASFITVYLLAVCRLLHTVVLVRLLYKDILYSINPKINKDIFVHNLVPREANTKTIFLNTVRNRILQKFLRFSFFGVVVYQYHHQIWQKELLFAPLRVWSIPC